MTQENLEKHKTLAQRYTNALLTSAQEDNIIEQVGQELKEIINIFNQNPDIENFFSSPIVKKEDKKDVLEQTFKGKINDKFYNFLNILTDKNRMFILPNVEYLYSKKLAEKANIIEVEVQTVIELDSDIQNALKEKLHKITGKNIQLKPIINKEIIGGVILNFEGQTIDGSVKTQLSKLQKQLI